MFLEGPYRWLQGFCQIKVEGYFLERFLNLCTLHKIELWNIERNNDAELMTFITRKDLKRIKEIASITKCKLEKVNQIGAFYLWLRYKERKWTLLVLSIFVFLIYAYSSRIWQIEIVGDFHIPIEELYEELNEEGVKIGMRKKDLDFDKVKNQIYIKRSDIAWLGFDIKGTMAIVEFVERHNKENEPLIKTPCNVLANKNGIIMKMTVKSGKRMVNVGDFVQSGDLLISGVVSSLDLSERRVHSDGDILLKTWYRGSARVPLERDVPVFTGRINRDIQIKIGKYQINFINNGTNFEKYDTINAEKTLRLFGKYNTGLQILETDYKEIRMEKISYTKEQAIQLAKKQALQELKKQVGVNETLLNESFYVNENFDSVFAEVEIACIENIGVKQPIE